MANNRARPTPAGTGFLLLLLAAGARAEEAPVPSLERCVERVRDQPASAESYDCFRQVAHRDGSFDRAIASVAAIAHRDPSNLRASLVLADLEADRGLNPEARYRAIASRAEATGDRFTALRSRLKLSSLLLKQQRSADAEAQLEQAEAAATSVGSWWPAVVETAKSRVAYARGDYARALILLKDAESRLFPLAPVEARSGWLSAMGATAWALTHFEDSASAYRKQAELLHAAGDRFEESRPLLSLVLLATIRLTSVEEQRRMAQTALDVAVLGGNRESEGRASFYLAQYATGREALDYARRSLAIARQVGDAGGVMMGLRATASLMAPYDRAEGFRLIDEAIETARRRGNLTEAARDRTVRARMSWKLGPRSQAIEDSLATLDTIEAERDLQQDSLVKAWRFSAWRTPYYELSGRLLAGDLLDVPGSSPPQSDIAQAFGVIERMRARMLLDSMDAAHATAAVMPQTPLGVRHIAVLKQIAALRPRLFDSELSVRVRSAATDDLERLIAEEAATRSALAASAPRFASLRAPHLASLDEVRAALDDDQALLSFQIASDFSPDRTRTFLGGSWLLAQTRDSTTVYRLPPYETIWTRVPMLVGLIGRRDGSEALGSTRIFSDLLERALARLPARTRRLVIVPDAPLQGLPFDVLRARADGAPLASRYEIAIVPSSTIWLRWKKSPPQPAAVPALVFADPDLTAVSRRAGPQAPELSLGPLPRAREEARAVVRDLGGGSEAYFGQSASEATLRSRDLSHYGMLHFASHAVVDSVYPDHSAILLARGSTREDGWLRPRDIVTMNLNGQVVVLSACRTASGALIEGEGVTGLAHAFFQAGAHTVIASLWPLRDDEAAEAFEKFYRRLGPGVRVGEALAAARRDLLGEHRPSAVWASLTLIGDPDVIPLARRRSGRWPSAPWIIVPAALLALALAAFAMRSSSTAG